MGGVMDWLRRLFGVIAWSNVIYHVCLSKETFSCHLMIIPSLMSRTSKLDILPHTYGIDHACSWPAAGPCNCCVDCAVCISYLALHTSSGGSAYTFIFLLVLHYYFLSVGRCWHQCTGYIVRQKPRTRLAQYSLPSWDETRRRKKRKRKVQRTDGSNGAGGRKQKRGRRGRKGDNGYNPRSIVVGTLLNTHTFLPINMCWVNTAGLAAMPGVIIIKSSIYILPVSDMYIFIIINPWLDQHLYLLSIMCWRMHNSMAMALPMIPLSTTRRKCRGGGVLVTTRLHHRQSFGTRQTTPPPLIHFVFR